MMRITLSFVVAVTILCCSLSSVSADEIHCCRTGLRASSVGYLPSDTNLLVQVNNVSSCATVGTDLGWLYVDLASPSTIRAATNAEVNQAVVSPVGWISKKYSALLDYDSEKHQLSMTIKQGDESIWSYTEECQNIIGFNEASVLGPSWISESMNNAYFIVPEDCSTDPPTGARVAIVSLTDPAVEPHWSTPTAETKELLRLRVGRSNVPVMDEQHLIRINAQAAPGGCVNSEVLSFTNDSVSARGVEYFPSMSITFVDPQRDRMVHANERDPNGPSISGVLQVHVIPLTGGAQRTIEFSNDEVLAALESWSSDDGSSFWSKYWWIFLLIGGVALVAVVAAVGVFMYIRHRRRQEAIEGQVDGYDPDLGYAEL